MLLQLARLRRGAAAGRLVLGSGARVRRATTGDAPAERPAEPEPDECCGKGCAECVWTVYWEKLQRHNAAQALASGEPPPEDPFQALQRRLDAEAAERERSKPSQ